MDTIDRFKKVARLRALKQYSFEKKAGGVLSSIAEGLKMLGGFIGKLGNPYLIPGKVMDLGKLEQAADKMATMLEAAVNMGIRHQSITEGVVALEGVNRVLNSQRITRKIKDISGKINNLQSGMI